MPKILLMTGGMAWVEFKNEIIAWTVILKLSYS